MGRARLLANDLRRGWRLLDGYGQYGFAVAAAVGLVMYWQDVFPEVAMVLLVGGIVAYGLLTTDDSELDSG